MRLRVEILGQPSRQAHLQNAAITWPEQANRPEQASTYRDTTDVVLHRFNLPVKPELRFENVWNLVEDRYKRNYLSDQQAALFSIKKLQDSYGADIMIEDTVEEIYDGVQEDRMVIRVVTASIDRASSIPPTSLLHPPSARKRQLEIVDEVVKRRRLEKIVESETETILPSCEEQSLDQEPTVQSVKPTLRQTSRLPTPSAYPDDRWPQNRNEVDDLEAADIIATDADIPPSHQRPMSPIQVADSQPSVSEMTSAPALIATPVQSWTDQQLSSPARVASPPLVTERPGDSLSVEDENFDRVSDSGQSSDQDSDQSSDQDSDRSSGQDSDQESDEELVQDLEKLPDHDLVTEPIEDLDDETVRDLNQRLGHDSDEEMADAPNFEASPLDGVVPPSHQPISTNGTASEDTTVDKGLLELGAEPESLSEAEPDIEDASIFSFGPSSSGVDPWAVPYMPEKPPMSANTSRRIAGPSGFKMPVSQHAQISRQPRSRTPRKSTKASLDLGEIRQVSTKNGAASQASLSRDAKIEELVPKRAGIRNVWSKEEIKIACEHGNKVDIMTLVDMLPGRTRYSVHGKLRGLRRAGVIVQSDREKRKLNGSSTRQPTLPGLVSTIVAQEADERPGRTRRVPPHVVDLSSDDSGDDGSSGVEPDVVSDPQQEPESVQVAPENNRLPLVSDRANDQSSRVVGSGSSHRRKESASSGSGDKQATLVPINGSTNGRITRFSQSATLNAQLPSSSEETRTGVLTASKDIFGMLESSFDVSRLRGQRKTYRRTSGGKSTEPSPPARERSESRHLPTVMDVSEEEDGATNNTDQIESEGKPTRTISETGSDDDRATRARENGRVDSPVESERAGADKAKTAREEATRAADGPVEESEQEDDESSSSDESGGSASENELMNDVPKAVTLPQDSDDDDSSSSETDSDPSSESEAVSQAKPVPVHPAHISPFKSGQKRLADEVESDPGSQSESEFETETDSNADSDPDTAPKLPTPTPKSASHPSLEDSAALPIARRTPLSQRPNLRSPAKRDQTPVQSLAVRVPTRAQQLAGSGSNTGSDSGSDSGSGSSSESNESESESDSNGSLNLDDSFGVDVSVMTIPNDPSEAVYPDPGSAMLERKPLLPSGTPTDEPVRTGSKKASKSSGMDRWKTLLSSVASATGQTSQPSSPAATAASFSGLARSRVGQDPQRRVSTSETVLMAPPPTPNRMSAVPSPLRSSRPARRKTKSSLGSFALSQQR